MPDQLDVRAIVAAASARGYFGGDLVKGPLTQEQCSALYAALDKKHIPLEPRDSAVDRKTALLMVNALRTGTVPPCELAALSVGRTEIQRRLVNDLTQVSQGKSRARFINASYGAGKTHSLWLLAERAFRERFAVSVVTLHPKNCPLSSLTAVYSAIVAGIHTRGVREQYGLERLLSHWIEMIQTDGKEFADRQIMQLPTYLVTALAEYAGATLNPVRQIHERRELMLRYLAGKPCLKRELKPLNLTHVIDDETALQTLGDIESLIRQLGFRGLCVFLDEAESVLSLSQGYLQDYAYGNLLRIVQSGNRLQRCFFIYAATPSFFEDYALYWGDEQSIPPEHIYELDPLEPDHYKQLARRISVLHGVAHAWSPPLDKMHRIAVPLSLKQAQVGNFVRSVIGILDGEMRNA